MIRTHIFMHPFSGGWLEIDTSDLRGIAAVVWELRLRTYHGSSKLPHKWFQRVCRRAGVRSIATRRLLEEAGAITGIGRYTMITLPPIHWKTFSGWQAEGYQIMRGSTAIAYFTPEGGKRQALFYTGQVVRATVTGRDIVNWPKLETGNDCEEEDHEQY